MRTIFTAPVISLAAALSLGILGANVAQATEITTQAGSESDHMPKSSRGSQNAEVDHMPTVRNDGNVEGNGVTGVLKPVYVPVFNEDGTPVLDADGKQVYKADYRWFPIGDGVEDAKIVKQY
jgi:hypothetical protein